MFRGLDTRFYYSLEYKIQDVGMHVFTQDLSMKLLGHGRWFHVSAALASKDTT